MQEIGNRIKLRREALGMSQDELGKKLGYKSRTSINKIELGNHSLPQSKIKQIADALQTTPSYIMGWDEQEDADNERLGYLIGTNPKRSLEVLELFLPMPEPQYDALISFVKASKKE